MTFRSHQLLLSWIPKTFPCQSIWGQNVHFLWYKMGSSTFCCSWSVSVGSAYHSFFYTTSNICNGNITFFHELESDHHCFLHWIFICMVPHCHFPGLLSIHVQITLAGELGAERYSCSPLMSAQLLCVNLLWSDQMHHQSVWVSKLLCQSAWVSAATPSVCFGQYTYSLSLLGTVHMLPYLGLWPTLSRYFGQYTYSLSLLATVHLLPQSTLNSTPIPSIYFEQYTYTLSVLGTLHLLHQFTWGSTPTPSI